MKIGIAITTRNRPDVCCDTFDILTKLSPVDSVIGVVDDASTTPPFGFGFTHNVFRFSERVGVGIAKNKCLELLHDAGCTDMFLFDDDCRPIRNGWWEPFVNSKYGHACWTFDRKVVFAGDDYVEYEKPNGCMLYFSREVIDKIGGWDLQFTGYGYEHCNISDRIFNAGLTPGRYISIPYTLPLFELANCESSFNSDDRMQIPKNLKLYQEKYYSKEFKPFK